MFVTVRATVEEEGWDRRAFEGTGASEKSRCGRYCSTVVMDEVKAWRGDERLVVD